MHKTRSFRLGHIIGAVVASFLIWAIVWLIQGIDSETSEKSVKKPSETKSLRTDVVKPSASPSVRKVDKRIKFVDPVVRKFVSLYYARNDRQTEKNMNELLRPFVTDRFMRVYSPDLSRSGDPWFRTNEAVITASGNALPGDYYTVSDNITVDTVVSQVQAATETSPSNSYTFTVTIELSWSDGWKVNSFL